MTLTGSAGLVRHQGASLQRGFVVLEVSDDVGRGRPKFDWAGMRSGDDGGVCKEDEGPDCGRR